MPKRIFSDAMATIVEQWQDIICVRLKQLDTIYLLNLLRFNILLVEDVFL